MSGFKPIPFSIKKPLLLAGAVLLGTTLAACSDSGSTNSVLPGVTTPTNPLSPVTPGDPAAPVTPDPVVTPETNPTQPVTPVAPPVTPVAPPVASGSELACLGNRVWSFGPNPDFPQFEELVSEGGGNFAGFEGSVAPCAAFWLYDASQGCSLLFTAEGFFNNVLGVEVPNPLVAQVGGSGEILVTAGSDQLSFPASGISFSQLANAPDCQ